MSFNVQIFFQETVFEVSTAINFNCFQRKSINMLSYASMLNRKTAMTILIHQDDIAKNLMTTKTTTNTGKNKNFSRKVQEEIVEAN